MYKIDDKVVMKCVEDATNVSNVGHWKACISSLFSLQCNGDMQLFFGAHYYRQHIVGERGHERLNVDSTIGMTVLQNTTLPYSWDCIRPISSLLHKFIPLQHGNSIIAYETQDLSWRTCLTQRGCVGCIPPWLEENDIVLVKSHLDALCTSNDLKY